MKRALGVILTFVMVICCTFTDALTANAQEGDAYAEYLAKKEAGLEIYEIIGEDGTVWAYFEPCSESEPSPILKNVIYDIKLLVPPGEIGYDYRKCDLEEGINVFIDISQNPTGATSYIGLRNNDTGTDFISPDTITTNGWTNYAKLIILKTGNYSIAIQNTSSLVVTYTGTFSY